jgi:hypothetical protein
MPTNKKKKKSEKRIGGAAQDPSPIESMVDVIIDPLLLPPFPGPETSESTMERIFGYKYVSLNEKGHRPTITDLPMSFSRGQNGSIVVKKYSKNMEPVSQGMMTESCFLEQYQRYLYPDYDRNTADYPVTREIMARVSLKGDLTRRVKKSIKDVPKNKLDIFLKFMELGEGITVRCGIVLKSSIAESYIANTSNNSSSLEEFLQVFEPENGYGTSQLQPSINFGSKVTFYALTFVDDVKYAGEGFFLCFR